MADLDTMRLTLRTKIGSPTVADVTNDTLTRLLNAAYREIGSKYAFNETRCTKTFNTIAGTVRYNVPDDLAALLTVWHTNKRRLRKRGVRYLASFTREPTTGTPHSYVRIKDYIQLVPEPDAVYEITIYYLTEIQDLTLDADTPVLPLPWHDGIVLKARHLYYDERGDIGKAIYCKNEWKDWVSDKPSEIDLEKDDIEEAVEVFVGSPYDVRARWRDSRYDPFFDTDG